MEVDPGLRVKINLIREQSITAKTVAVIWAENQLRRNV
jgi:hypothetical protein